MKLRFLLMLLVLVSVGCGCTKDSIETEPNGGNVYGFNVQSNIRGKVPVKVYLPPGWEADGKEDYPLIFFLHGQWGNESSFFEDVDYRQMNKWINEGKLPPFVLVSVASYFENKEEQQWSSLKNEILLTSDEQGELRAFCREKFRAGVNRKSISIQGQSRGARGALHYAFKYPDLFSSAISNAFVSDYALAEEKENASTNTNKIKASGIKIRMVIGTEDNWVIDFDRRASYIMHDYLNELGILHEFEVLQGAGHSLSSMWNTHCKVGVINGLYELKLHAESWK